MALPVVLGRGELYVGGTYIGNCTQVKFAPKMPIMKHYDCRGGQKVADWIFITQREFSGSFQTDYITPHNVSLFLIGAMGVSLRFVGKNPISSGPSVTYSFTDVTITPGGDADLIGDDWQKLPFNFEGTSVPSAGVSAGDQGYSEWISASTTTTSTTTTTTTTTTTV
jgi:hypothetical protein